MPPAFLQLGEAGVLSVVNRLDWRGPGSLEKDRLGPRNCGLTLLTCVL